MSETQAQATIELDLESHTDALLLASFPDATKFRDPSMQFELRRNFEEECKFHLASETEGLSLVGTNYGRASKKFDTTQWLVGVFDPVSCVIDMKRIDHVFPVRSMVKNPLYLLQQTSLHGSKYNSKDRRELLFEDFGARKKRKQLETKKNNIFSLDEAVGGDQLEHVFRPDVDDAIDHTNAALLEAKRILLPPFNLDAKTASNVYDTSKVLSTSEWAILRRDTLPSFSDAGKTARGTKIGSQPRFVSSRWPAALRATSSSASQLHVNRLALLQSLISLHLKQYPKVFRCERLHDEAKQLGISPEVLKILLQRFALRQADGSIFRITKVKGDRILLFILVLSIQEVEPEPLRISEMVDDLKVPINQLSFMLREIGCIIRGGNSTEQVAELIAPLKFQHGRRNSN